MSELEKIRRWSLDRVQFMLNHIGDFIDDEEKELRERARNFVPQTGLDKIESLGLGDPMDPALPVRMLERLAPFFDAGLLLQRGLNEESNWWATDLFLRGNTFHLEVKDQARATGMLPELTPAQVQRTPAQPLLNRLNMSFLSPASDAQSFLFKPTENVAYLLVTNVAAPWLEDHVKEAHRLINKSFLY